MTTQVGSDAKIPDVWRKSALSETCPKQAREQMLQRLDEVGENYQTLKVKVISLLTQKN